MNHRRKPTTRKMKLVLRVFERAVRRGFVSSNFAMDLAHMRGATAVHTAAQHGRHDLVRWLLEHEARPSLRVKNAMGCTPLDILRAFGPYLETAVVLIQATLSLEFDWCYDIRPDGQLQAVSAWRQWARATSQGGENEWGNVHGSFNV